MEEVKRANLTRKLLFFFLRTKPNIKHQCILQHFHALIMLPHNFALQEHYGKNTKTSGNFKINSIKLFDPVWKKWN